tara:strand:+ start:83 stop:466 length:384 start_codon:yes stop_codon:yes gene_type:complete
MEKTAQPVDLLQSTIGEMDKWVNAIHAMIDRCIDNNFNCDEMNRMFSPYNIAKMSDEEFKSHEKYFNKMLRNSRVNVQTKRAIEKRMKAMQQGNQQNLNDQTQVTDQPQTVPQQTSPAQQGQNISSI